VKGMAVDMSTDKQIADKRTAALVAQVSSKLPAVASVDEFVQLLFGEDYPKDENGRPRGLQLGVEKFRRGRREKCYRLIWIGRDQACLAAESQDEFQTKTPAKAAGYELAAALGVEFDSRTR
jgi:hypothetical protein